MPLIKQYENSVAGLSPTETGIEATAAAARRAGGFFNQAAEAISSTGDRFTRNLKSSIEDAGQVAVAYEDHRQISQGAASLAAFTQAKTKAWDDTLSGYTDADGVVHPKADPHDPEVNSRFMASMETDFTKLRESFWTDKAQNWAESHIESVRNHFQTKTNADMAHMAEVAVVSDYKTIQNTLSNTAMMSPDAVPDLLKQAKSGIEALVGSSPNLKGVTGFTVSTKLGDATAAQIVKAGAIGAIRKSADPEATAAEWANKYPDQINGAEVKQLADAARQQIRFNKAEERANAAMDKAEKRDRADKAVDALELDTTTVNGKGELVGVVPKNAKERLNALVDAGASPGRISTLVTRIERIGAQQDEMSARNLERRSKATQADLYDRTRSGQITSTDEYDKAYKDDNLTWNALQALKKNFYEDKSESGQPLASRRNEAVKALEAIVDPARVTIGSKSSLGSQALDNFHQWLRQKETEYRTSKKDPQSIYDYDKDGNSVASIGARQFRVGLSESIQSKILNLTGQGQKELGVEVKDAPVSGMPYTVNGETRVKVGGKEYKVVGDKPEAK